MENKVFGEIKTTEELNELAVNLRKTKEFDEIRQLCKENNIPDDAAEDFIAGKRLHLADPGHQEKNDPNGDTGKMTGAGKRGENIRHFTSGHKDENTYGWPWNEVVKKYLESGYSSDQKECQVTIREKEYKILKRDAVTVFYDADGNTLFDVTNDRLKREYESDQGEEEENEENSTLVEMGTASLVDAVTGNVPAPTPEEVETAEKANAGDVQAKAKQKLEEELKHTNDKNFSGLVINHLLRRCEEDPEMAAAVVQEHKTFEKCGKYIIDKARTRADHKFFFLGGVAAISSDEVFGWAEEYFRLDDKAIEEQKEKERREQEEKRKSEAAKKKKTASKPEKTAKKNFKAVKGQKKTASKPGKTAASEKKNEKASKNKEVEGQMSLFDF